MDIGTLSLLLLLGMVVLLVIGMPLAFASGALAAAVLIMKFGPDLLFGNFGMGPLSILGQRIYGITTDYVMISVPLFIFMANLLEKSGIAAEMYSSLQVWLNRTRGGIAVVTSIMAVVMAAMSGIVGGEVVLLGLIALPQMLRLGYDRNLAIGTICASGSLGTMIPPSIVLIMYGLVTETSIKALFTASFLPGFMLAMFYMVYILVRTRMNPSLAPLPEPSPDEPSGGEKRLLFGVFVAILVAVCAALWTVQGIVSGGLGAMPLVLLALAVGTLVLGRGRIATAWSMGRGLVAPLVVIGVVLGSIYGGITGITEAAGMGAVAVMVLTALRRELTLTLVWDSLVRTLLSTGTILWVTIGATALAGAYTIVGGPTYIAGVITGAELPSMMVILVMMIIFLFLGAFMDWIGIVLLVMPVFLPIVRALPVEEIGLIGSLDPSMVAIWFGVVFCMNMQVSFLSPPFGPAAFYLKSVAPPEISLTDIFRGFLPFICLQLLALCVLLAWPGIVTLLL
jgi:TRAP-type mannitol/chloroaromatic compound transport system permease large subunit